MRYTLLLLLALGLLLSPASGCASPPAGAVLQHAEAIKTADQDANNSQSSALKQQHDEAKKLSQKLIELVTEVDADIDKSGENVLPLSTLKKLEEIEKTARKLRSLLKQ